jgi:catechol-2,3-dioxygenase
VHIPRGKSLNGIARFYDYVLGAPTLQETVGKDSISVVVSPQQTLTFKYAPIDRRADSPAPMPHEVLDWDEQVL